MRVVSLVPSLTETLAECGVNLVARTRFCVHPAERLRAVPAVGGTKDLNEAALAALKPDLLVVDREENLPWMAERAPCRVFVSHAIGVDAMGAELRRLAAELGGGEPARALQALAARYELVAAHPAARWDFARIPGGEILNPAPATPDRLEYVIWKKPWMKIGPGTYIHSVLEKLGAGAYLPPDGAKYPEFAMEELPAGSFLLFSSEPFPFARKPDELRALRDPAGAPRPAALVDGEGYSWFGIRSLRFLEGELGLPGT